MPDPATLALIASSLAGLFTGGRKQTLPAEQLELLRQQGRATETSRQGQEIENALNRLKLSRRRQSDPLHRALQHMAAMRLPIFAQQGFDFSNLLNPTPEIDKSEFTQAPRGRAVPVDDLGAPTKDTLVI